MFAIYDHLIAILVGGVIILMLFNVQQRSQKSSVERTMMYMTKTSTLETGSFLERDLMNAGYNTPPVENGVLEHNTNGDGITDTLLFWGVGSAGTRTRIAYGVTAVDTAYLEGQPVTLYQLRRYERQGSNYVEVGGSQPVLTEFKITLLTSGNAPTDIFTADKLKVRMAQAVMPDFEDEEHLVGYRQLYWGVTLDPPGLQ